MPPLSAKPCTRQPVSSLFDTDPLFCFDLISLWLKKKEQPVVSRDKVNQTLNSRLAVLCHCFSLRCRWQSLMCRGRRSRRVWTLVVLLDSAVVWLWKGKKKKKKQQKKKQPKLPVPVCTCFVTGECKRTVPTVSPVQFSTRLICLSASPATCWTTAATCELLFKRGRLWAQCGDSSFLIRLLALWLSMFSRAPSVFFRGARWRQSQRRAAPLTTSRPVTRPGP